MARTSESGACLTDLLILNTEHEEEERRHQELLAKRKADEEREKAHKLAKAARALELKKEQELKKEERKQERERERQAAAENLVERLEKEKAIALQKELERAAREKENMRKMSSVLDSPVGEGAVHNKTIDHGPGLNVTVDIEVRTVFDSPIGEGAGLNVTVDIEQSPQSYQITPKGQKVNPKDFGMDQNSDYSTDDESAPVKAIPSWAEGMQVKQAITEQYHNPLDLDSYFGEPEPPKLEEIFRWTKSCFFKCTSSAIWHSSPCSGNLGN
ncbi:hypothetical protein G5714_023788 [Onychostoma macrolepis]|uniref:Inner centromere protein ARK-binding domain-containing protein n=1 Tax=Onychostoma macrolepis TaxID=369639 RepID=A0A7J6BHV6_9TELE|nr:hypothetical protein G5714_023788 [Onychostoma macrolepis]